MTDQKNECSGTEQDCQKALAELYVFLDGVLDDERRSQIKGHLDGCMHCFEAFDFEVELRQVVAQCCREEVPSELRERILKMLDEDAAS